MSRFYRMALAFMFACMFTITNDLKAEGKYSNVKLKTYEGGILWAGYDYPDDFDPSLIKDDAAKKAALDKGLEIYEERARAGSSIHQEVLAVYYVGENDLKKGLYWANKCAEQGSSKGMYLLSLAYAQGQGIVKDIDESFKWLVLAAAAGEEEAIEMLDNLRNELNDFDSNGWIQQCQKNAQAWTKENPKAFFNPD